MNFKNIGNDTGAAAAGCGGRLPGNLSLDRQPSVYSLTLDEFMSSMGGSGKDFGFMNMDELLKNIWTAEELQTVAGQQGTGTPAGAGSVGHLQRQGSLTLPRTVSHKTVDEVWKDISKDCGPTGTRTGGTNLSQMQRQQTLGEMTLEEFLVRAGVVREDAQSGGKQNGGVLTDLGTMEFQQLNKGAAAGLMGNNDPLALGSHSYTNLPLNVNGVRSNQPQVHNSQLPRQQNQIFPKQAPAMAYAAQLGDQGIRGGMVGLVDQGLKSNLVPGSGLQGGGIGVVGLAPPGGVVHHVTTGSPDEIGKSSGDTSSVSPVPFGFNGGLRGRKSGGAVDKVIERRQRRMIKNRESAARSRARKQAYTMELEAEVAKLKEENEELQSKQAEIVEIQKNHVNEMMNLQRGVKKRCLRRSQTGPW